ncbi:oligopeptide:H+ symporter [Acetobacter sp. DsW_063]|uniref:oligopeptide:H+ symporter n=1 Tax=Acetobacter sp. DsW_063 TaxID=1514894 RepID=UPI000A3610DA|nr:oligopeptide:H+ symporter [Acetobacter sp. DsW_063]
MTSRAALSILGRPWRALFPVLMFEATERFGFYGLQGLLLLYLTRSLNMPESDANLIAGSFSGVAYASTLLGGAIGGRLFGARAAALVGAALQGCALAAACVATDKRYFLFVLAAVAMANGLTRPNVATLVRALKLPEERADGLFTLYALAVNLGAALAFLVAPWLARTEGWAAAFGLCASCVIVGMVVLGIFAPRSGADRQPDSGQRWRGAIGLVVVAAAVLCVFWLLNDLRLGRYAFQVTACAVPVFWATIWARCDERERRGVLIALLLIAQAMFYALFDEQTTSTFILFALHDVGSDFRVGGVTIAHLSGAQFVAVNAGLTMALAPLFARLYQRLGKIGREPPLHTKYLIGSSFIVLSFGLLWLLIRCQDGALLSPWGLTAGYALISVAGLLMNSLGLAVVSEYVPLRFNGVATALFYIALGTAMYAGGVLSNAFALHDLAATASQESVRGVFARLFRDFTLLAIAGFCVLLVLQPVLRRMQGSYIRG